MKAISSIQIENVRPAVDGGRYPVKRVVDDKCVVEADIFRDGHAVIAAVVKWKEKHADAYHETPLRLVNNDAWKGEFLLEKNTRYVFNIEAWTNHVGTWFEDFKKRVQADQDVRSEVLEGIKLLERVAGEADGAAQKKLETLVKKLKAFSSNAGEIVVLLSDPALQELIAANEPRDDRATLEKDLEVVVDRVRAESGAWYEFFIRSETDDVKRSGTFKSAEQRLPQIAALGFDVIYLAPIHPIGHTARKGRNNALHATPGDPGSPWAIGSKDGGHTAIEPSLGTMADFDHFMKTAKQNGLEVAMDFALQCSPDHPWTHEHPEWFYRRPDGTIKYAENPPMKYEDIYPLNFNSTHRKELWEETLKVLLFWIKRGVKIFRVDNPHTKPLPFWEWLISSIQEKHPDVIFLAEAFTRPKIMKALSKAGFTQSYTYFIWRNDKNELAEYMKELTHPKMADYFRPNFFANTHDILPPVLKTGGVAAFKVRAALAALLSPSWGIYAGYELCENEAVPGKDEYQDSEIYEIKPRDWNKPGNISAFIAALNRIRGDNPALLKLQHLQFFQTENPQIIFFGRWNEDKSNVVFVAINLDSHNPQQGTAWMPLETMGLPVGGRFEVADLISGATYTWTDRNYVRLDPHGEPVQIFRVERRFV